METEMTNEKKLTANEAIVLLLQCINADKLNDFYSVAERYGQTLAQSGDYYFKVKKLIRDKPARFMTLTQLPNEIKKLVSVSDLEDENVFLNPRISKLIDELLFEWKNSDVFSFHNLPIRNKILLHGPTGNGKTTIARHIARKISLPFIEVSSDMVIDSHLGSTGGNIKKIFDQVKEPCVLFWDEIDSIGRLRSGKDGNSASVENERMVNSILVNLEKLSHDVIFIGATNRMDILDPAFIRRFNIKHLIDSPTDIEKRNYARQLFKHHNLSELLSDYAAYSSFSEIKQAVIDEGRTFVIKEMANSQTALSL